MLLNELNLALLGGIQTVVADRLFHLFFKRNFGQLDENCKDAVTLTILSCRVRRVRGQSAASWYCIIDLKSHFHSLS
jgi:hypothetical protein